MSNKGGSQDRAQHRAILADFPLNPTALVIGIDPDSRNVGLCGWWARLSSPEWVATTHVKSSGVFAAQELFDQCRAVFEAVSHRNALIVVEAMRIHRNAGDSSTKNPQSLVDLSFLGGIVAAAALATIPASTVLPVEASYWKGTLKKKVQHSRLLTQLGWDKQVLSDYARPKTFPADLSALSQVSKGDWKHVMDAIGLAQWGVRQLEDERRRRARVERRGG